MSGNLSHMQPERADEKLLVKYLLGYLSEDEQVEIEDRAFVDKTYLAQLEAAEVDLIDAYINGDLRADERRAFEGRFLTSPQRRRKVQFARDLARAAAQHTVTEPRSMFSVVTRWTPRFQLAGAFAAVVVVAGVSWLALQNAAMRARIAALEDNRRESESREEALRRQVAEQKRPANMTVETDPGERVPLVPALVLAPGLTRGESTIPELTLNASAQIANIEVRLEPRDEFPSYRAELLTRKGEEILAVSNLRRHQNGAASLVLLSVPVSNLASGDYELSLKGVAADRSMQDIGYYYFSVKKQ